MSRLKSSSIHAFVPFLLVASMSVSARTELTVDPNKEYQTIYGFGASDCWTIQYVGKYWDDCQKKQTAEWLFSNEIDDQGNPQGIGLSLWRINIGAGTIEQGDSSRIKDLTRRAESFLDVAGNYDFSKQMGQQWFAMQAKRYGCGKFVLFSNSPPLRYTREGFANGNKDGQSNLRPDSYKSFARFLVDVTAHFYSKLNLPVELLSPVNEPQWPWDGVYQEGSPWANEEIKRLAIAIDSELSKRKLPTRLLIPEAGSWETTYQEKGRASNQLYAFWDPKSPNYIGYLRSLAPIFAGHSYWTDSNNQQMEDVRRQVKKMADKYGVKIHQTEWSLLSKSPLQGMPENPSYLDIALYMGKVIHADLTVMDVPEWTFWTSLDAEQWGFKNRFNLIRMNIRGGDYAPATNGGTVCAMKTLWALGHYSRFVRPGYRRIDISNGNDYDGLLASAYLHPQNKELVIVITNNAQEAKQTHFGLPTSLLNPHQKSVYLTDANHDLQLINTEDVRNGIIPGRSIVTVVYGY